ncbi:DUF4238 domain-containing protein [Bacillus sp. NP157]|nr:DUF4238 domain-containing protein [Bacillus sp. NP157]
MPNSRPIKRNNHYVPSVYLKQWATNGMVQTYRLLVPHERVHLWKSVSLKGIAHHRNLYTYVGESGETDEFETWLDRTFEAPAEPVIARALRGAPMSVADWQTLVRFTAAQDVRTPRRLKEFIDRQAQSLPQLMERTLAEGVRKFQGGSWRDHAEPPHPQLALAPDLFQVRITDTGEDMATVSVETTIGRRMWIECCRMLLTSTVQRLMRHRWTIWRAPPGITWPTSDNPVVRLNYYGPGHYDLKGGWGRPNGEILMPLSPTTLLYTKVGERPPRRGSVMPEPAAQSIRRILVENADRMVFEQTESDVALLRPRHVDATACAQEREALKNWGPEQSAAEQAVWEFKGSTKRC